MERLIEQLKQFHRKFGVPVLSEPHIPDFSRRALRRSLIEEECSELLNAIDQSDLVEVADGIADLIYVAVGTALEFGLPLERIWEEVHRTNMLKIGGAQREDGKILKPEGWKPPEIERILHENR